MRDRHPNLNLRRVRRLSFVVTLAATGLLMFAVPAFAVDLIDATRVPPNESLRVTSDGARQVTQWGSLQDEQARNLAELGFVPETDADTQKEIERQEDWCKWAALGAAAAQIFNGSSESPADILYNSLLPCLATHLQNMNVNGQSVSVGGLDWGARALVIQSEIHMSQQLNGTDPQTALSLIENQGLTYSPSTWVAWFTFERNALPPSDAIR